MALAVTFLNDVPVYNLSAGKSLPQFMEDAKNKGTSLRYNEEFRKRVELIQDFEYPISSHKVKCSKGGQHICSVGTYPPEMRMYDLQEMSMKFCRRTDAETIDLTFLGDDYKKVAILGNDRTIEFHAQYGLHHKLRIPKFGRSLAYDRENCCLYVSGSSEEIYILDLEGGQFLQPVLSSLEFVNQSVINPKMPLLALAGANNTVECWDLRDMKSNISTLNIGSSSSGFAGVFQSNGITNKPHEATCIDFSNNGMHIAVGSTNGVVKVYDIRSNKVLLERDHKNALPIKSVKYHENTRGNENTNYIASCDAKSIKIWDSTISNYDNGVNQGNLLTCIESDHVLNDIEFFPDSGLIFAAQDNQRMGQFFVPALGVAPKWCSFLDNMTEELTETAKHTVFDDFQFVSKEMLAQIGATELIGTKYLNPYMHGYFMDASLFKKLNESSDVFAYEEYLKKKT